MNDLQFTRTDRLARRDKRKAENSSNSSGGETDNQPFICDVEGCPGFEKGFKSKWHLR